jgi:hypothetical protein
METNARTIVLETRFSDSILYTFDDGSSVNVCFTPKPSPLANVPVQARLIAEQFFTRLDPPGIWTGKIDMQGKILESPIDLEII